VLGENATWSTTSRSLEGTLVAGIEVSPFGSLIAPGGRPAVEETSAVGAETLVRWPAAFLAVTRNRIVWPVSLSFSVYALSRWPASSTQLLPTGSQRTHWNENVIGWTPDHVPGSPWSVEPGLGVPVIDGALAAFGGFPVAAVTVAVGFDATVAEPSALLAVTRTRRRFPTSAVPTTYADVVAPEIAAQSEPSGLPPEVGQRTHWYANVIGDVPDQSPCDVVSVAPCVAVPLMLGSAVFFGAACVTARAGPLVRAPATPSASAPTSTPGIKYLSVRRMPLRPVVPTLIFVPPSEATDLVYLFPRRRRRFLTASLRLLTAPSFLANAALTSLALT